MTDDSRPATLLLTRRWTDAGFQAQIMNIVPLVLRELVLVCYALCIGSGGGCGVARCSLHSILGTTTIADCIPRSRIFRP